MVDPYYVSISLLHLMWALGGGAAAFYLVKCEQLVKLGGELVFVMNPARGGSLSPTPPPVLTIHTSQKRGCHLPESEWKNAEDDEEASDPASRWEGQYWAGRIAWAAKGGGCCFHMSQAWLPFSSVLVDAFSGGYTPPLGCLPEERGSSPQKQNPGEVEGRRPPGERPGRNPTGTASRRRSSGPAACAAAPATGPSGPWPLEGRHWDGVCRRVTCGRRGVS